MAVETGSAFWAWCDRDPEGVCEIIGPFGWEEQADDALREHHEREHPQSVDSGTPDHMNGSHR